jgi:hypothetical protein
MKILIFIVIKFLILFSLRANAANVSWYLETKDGINGLHSDEYVITGSQIGNKLVKFCVVLKEIKNENGIIKNIICETIFNDAGFILRHDCPNNIKINEKSYGEWHSEYFNGHAKKNEFRLFCKGN